jgi:hypothetical protein
MRSPRCRFEQKQRQRDPGGQVDVNESEQHGVRGVTPYPQRGLKCSSGTAARGAPRLIHFAPYAYGGHPASVRLADPPGPLCGPLILLG